MLRYLHILIIGMVFILLVSLGATTGCAYKEQNNEVGTCSDLVPKKKQIIQVIHESSRIYENKIVWTEWRNNEPAMYLYDLCTNSKHELPVSKASRTSQYDIYGNTIVWSLGTWDAIMAYDINTETQTEIVTRTGPHDHKCNPSIYRNKVVWEDYRDGGSQIYMYDLASKTETLISDVDHDPEQINNGGSPGIFENKIVWKGMSSGTWWDIYMYDLGPDGIKDTNDDGGLTQITNARKTQAEPKNYENIIVWMDDRNNNDDDKNNNWDIYMYDLSARKETQITKDSNFQGNPDIYGNIIVWNDSRNGCCNIYAWDIKAQQEIKISSTISNQQHAAVYKEKIVWTDYDDGEIYLATVPIPISQQK